MRVGVFTPLLSQLPLTAVLKKLAALQINTVELATGNYVGDAHCKLSMLEDAAALSELKKIIADHGVTISALSCHGQPARILSGGGAARPRGEPQNHPAGRKTWRTGHDRFFGLPPAIRRTRPLRIG